MTWFEIDPFSVEHLAAPFPALKRIREHSGAHYVSAHDFYILTRYSDVVAASRNYAVFSSTGGVGLEFRPRPMMPMYDPPEHSRLRRLVAPAFSPKAIAALAVRLTQKAEALVAALPRDVPFDFASAVAEPISLEALSLLLDVPRDMQERFRHWADNTMADLAGGVDEATSARIEVSRKEFVVFLRESLAKRTDEPGDDIISMLIHAAGEDRLTQKEVLAFCVLLLVAGFEPSANAMVNFAMAVVEHHAAFDTAAGNPERLSLFTEEVLRFDSPVQSFFRDTKRAIVVDGVEIPAGKKVMIHFGAANRDPAVFTRPDDFVADRDPNEHIAFGAGPHFCLGAQLARAELNALSHALHAAGARLEFGGPLLRQDNLLFRCVKRLPVVLRRG